MQHSGKSSFTWQRITLDKGIRFNRSRLRLVQLWSLIPVSQMISLFPKWAEANIQIPTSLIHWEFLQQALDIESVELFCPSYGRRIVQDLLPGGHYACALGLTFHLLLLWHLSWNGRIPSKIFAQLGLPPSPHSASQPLRAAETDAPHRAALPLEGSC